MDLDNQYPLYKDNFVTPTYRSLGIALSTPDKEVIYFCGNSLGLMPKAIRKAINDELDAWGQRAVESHFNHPTKTPWMDIDLPVLPLLAPIVGAQENEVAVAGSLTANLNALLVSFYKPNGPRTKILFEKHAFPSDYYAFLNLVKLHGFDESHLIQVEVPKGKTHLDTETILNEIKVHADELALIALPGVQYYTGQFFDIKTITEVGHSVGAIVGWDLAHAVGNVPLELHNWGVDFAVWCSYKYLNSGPGAMAGFFVHEKFTKHNSSANFTPRLAGWWGNNAATRFQMLEKFDPIDSALSYRQSNPSVIDVVSVKASLEVFAAAGGVQKLREKSLKLTGYLESLLKESRFYIPQDSTNTDQLGFQILTPLDPEGRGSQLSLLFHPHHDDDDKNVMELVNSFMRDHGVICDERRPDVIRIAPAALYNTFVEVETVVKTLVEALETIRTKYN